MASAPPSASSLSPTITAFAGSTPSRSQAVVKIFGSGLITPSS